MMVSGYNEHDSPFNSFWMGGYECSDKLNAFGNRVDLLSASGHLKRLSADYGLLNQFNIKTVREGIRWSFVEPLPYQYNWDVVDGIMDVAFEHGIQIIWDLCHFGFPDDLTPLHPMFARRFAALCRSFVTWYRTKTDQQLIVTPINEVNFLSWLGGDVRGTSPYCVNNGWEVKYGLMKAYVEGVAAMKEIDPSVLILSTEPLVNIVAPFDASEEQILASETAHQDQFQSMDMLMGRICPELGGHPSYLDIMGFNYYYNNQWEWGQFHPLPWANENNDPRFQPLGRLLKRAYDRYNLPFIVSETSHPGEHRASWIEAIGTECLQLKAADLPLLGVCIYPIIDRPDWDHTDYWHQSGLWDSIPGNPLSRILVNDFASTLLKVQEEFSTVFVIEHSVNDTLSESIDQI